MTSESGSSPVHYGRERLLEHIKEVLSKYIVSGGRVTLEVLGPLDQFHSGGQDSTRELSLLLEGRPGLTVLDVGSGLGGPARVIADAFDCLVTGVDLNPAFVETAQFLSSQVTFRGTTQFVCADALSLPFADESFERVYSQHVCMNISDRKRFVGEIQRVLKPSGRFVFYDVLAGNSDEIHFPVPWARNDRSNFLLGEDETFAILAEAGFREISRKDNTEVGIQWIEKRKKEKSEAGFSLTDVMGPGFREMSENFKRNLLTGKVRLMFGVFEREGIKPPVL